MNFKEVLRTLIERFQNQGIDFAQSGGLALTTLNIFRFTADLDLMIPEESQYEMVE